MEANKVFMLLVVAMGIIFFFLILVIILVVTFCCNQKKQDLVPQEKVEMKDQSTSPSLTKDGKERSSTTRFFENSPLGKS